MHVIDTGAVLLPLPRVHDRLLQNGLTDAVKRLGRTGQDCQQAHNTFCGMLNVPDVRKRVEAQLRTIEVHPAGLVTVVLVAVAHVDNPGKSACVQHVAQDALRQEGLSRPGGAGYGNVEVSAAVFLPEHVKERHLIAVGRQRHAQI